MKQRIFNTLALFIVQIVMACGLVYGQQPVGNIAGIVTDPSGSVLPNATITITSLSTGIARTITSNNQGYFLAAALQADAYKVKVSVEGFSTYEIDRLVVEVGQTPNLNVSLKVGVTNEIVQITGADTSLVDSVQTNVGGVVSVKQIEQLPLNGRNYLELAKLQPGVEIQEGSAFDVTKSRYSGISISSRGGREARITIDGIDSVDEHVGTTTLNISQDSIQEFQVSTSSSDPSAGLSATGSVNVITKRGTNQLHGSAFAVARGSQIAARPSFAAKAPNFRREQFGGNAGGTIIKDKLFGFANFERTQEKSILSINTPYFPNLTSFRSPYTLNSFTGRTDYHLSDKHDTFLRVSVDDNSNAGGFGGNILPSGGNFNKNRTYQLAAGFDSVLSTKLTNSIRVGGTNFKNNVTRPDADAQALTIPGFEKFRIVTSDGRLTSGPDNNTPQSTAEVFTQFRDDITYFNSKHTIRTGADVVRYKARVFNFAFGFPTINVAPDPDPLVDRSNFSTWKVSQFTIGNLKGIRIPGAEDNSHRNTRLSFYGEDSWRIKPNLTVSYGARYEMDTHPVNNDLKKPDVLKNVLPKGTDATPLDRNNVSPHIGIAYDPFKDGKTSIRVGFGIYYAQQISNLVTQERSSLVGFNLGQNTLNPKSGDLSKSYDFNGDSIPDFNFGNVFTGNLGSALSVIAAGQAQYAASPASTTKTPFDVTRTGVVISNDLETPYSEQFNIGVQRELPYNSVIDINLIYHHSLHEFQRDVDGANVNKFNGSPIAPGDGSAAALKQIGVIRSDGFSRYKALTVRYDKKFGKAFQMTGSYAFSKLETTSSDGFGLGQAERFVNRLNSGNLGVGPLDRRHRFVFNGIVELPYGFRLSGISTAYSSLPVSAVMGTSGYDFNKDGIESDLLPLTRRGSIGRSITTVQQLNDAIHKYNLDYAGKPLANGGTGAYLADVNSKVIFGDSFISQDFQLSYGLKIKEGIKVEATAQVFNAFNVSNLVGARGLPASPFSGVLTPITKLAPGESLNSTGQLLTASGQPSIGNVNFGSGSAIRPSIPTGTGLPRAAQFGLRLVF